MGCLVLLLATTSAAWEPLELLEARIASGERRELSLLTSETFAGFSVATPVVVVRGTEPGPTLCLVGGIHGDELNGVEAVRRALARVQPGELRGTLIGVPIANLHGFRRSSRYLPDRRDLNRYFPGRASGSAASRIAHHLFDGVVRHCDALVDFHTGSFHRTNIPQVRADLGQETVEDLALGFGATLVVNTRGTQGTLRRAAVEAGIPAITYEAGEPMEFREEEVELGVQGVLSVMRSLRMTSDLPQVRPEIQVFERSRWVRADRGGLLLARVVLGDAVSPGETLGTVTDPITNESESLRSPYRGRVIGMAVNQVVIPGFAAFHIGLERDGDEPAASDEPLDPLDDPFEIDERPE